MEDPIQASIEDHDGVAVLSVRGDIDMGSASAFKSAIAEALAKNPAALVIDLLGVEFFGSIGVSVLLQAHKRVNDDARFAVIADRPVIAQLTRLLRLDEVFALHETLAEALNALEIPPRGKRRAAGAAERNDDA
ncbi:STAS domain-containing protein [Mycobacterium cookii]|uniref:STAS domain-containing protein n=1 Tax=Mycobacterium cookii TaxID=1775 RepID=UPI0021F3498C|nr:STAS domain-containing protein [Mycobacterium cookii]MCV7330096.1 STAS domain-containing protein [Mycobacterium cookii]